MKRTKAILLYAIAFIFTMALTVVRGYSQYYPPPDNWEERDATSQGLNETALDEAVRFAQENEYSGSRDLRIAILEGFSREPYHDLLGPVKKRGGPAGLIIRNGYIVKKWGDLSRVDMTFSVTKSYLSTVAGLASDENLIELNDPVGEYVWDGTFDGEHNGQITWDHLLTQSSDWSGTLFGIHDWADRPPREGGVDDWRQRELRTPGTYFEYNDVRVNVLAYSLLHVWRKPLPVVLKEKIMDRIGASSTWRWYGYDNSWAEIDGLRMQSVSGGGHSGGGMFINTYDQARFGLLFLRDGLWEGVQLLSSDWIQRAAQPSAANERYGYMWWLNRGDAQWEGLPETAYYAAGFGGNYIIIIPDQDMLIVTRWLEPSRLGAFMDIVKGALNQ